MTDQPVPLVHPALPGQPIQVASYEDVHRAAGWRRLEDALEHLVGIEDATDHRADVAENAAAANTEHPTGETPDNPPQASPRRSRRSTTS